MHERYVGELVNGDFRESERRGVEAIVEVCATRAHRLVILGGTELPLLMRDPTIAGLRRSIRRDCTSPRSSIDSGTDRDDAHLRSQSRLLLFLQAGVESIVQEGRALDRLAVVPCHEWESSRDCSETGTLDR